MLILMRRTTETMGLRVAMTAILRNFENRCARSWKLIWMISIDKYCCKLLQTLFQGPLLIVKHPSPRKAPRPVSLKNKTRTMSLKAPRKKCHTNEDFNMHSMVSIYITLKYIINHSFLTLLDLEYNFYRI